MQRLLLILACVFALCLAFDLNAMKAQFYNQVAPPYHSALTTISTDIIEFLANAPIPDNSSEATVVAQHLDTKIRLVSDYLVQASAASDVIRQQLDARVLQLTSDGSRSERQIQETQQQSNQVQEQIRQTATQLQDAQNQVGQGEASVQHAEQSVRDEEAQVERQRHCIGKRSWLGDRWEVIRKKVCGVFNSGGIDQAKNAREASYRRLAEARARLDQLRAQLANLQQQQAASINRKSSLESTRTDLGNQLRTTSIERDRIVVINTALKSLMAHMGTLLGKSGVLIDVVTRLIDMETVIGPIQSVGEQILNYTGEGHSSDSEKLLEIKRKIRENLPLVKKSYRSTL